MRSVVARVSHDKEIIHRTSKEKQNQPCRNLKAEDENSSQKKQPIV